MKHNNKTHSLFAINPTDYKDYYSNYHKRKKQNILLKEGELPNIKFNLKSLKTETNSNQDIDLNNFKTSSNNNPFIKSEKSFKSSSILTYIKNNNSQFKTKYPKKNGLLSIKYLDIINVDKRNKMLIYEINKNEKNFEREIIGNIIDSTTKNIIINKLKDIDTKTRKQIENLIRNTTSKAKEESLRYLENQPKIVYLGAEEIFEEISNHSRIETAEYFDKFDKKIKEKNSKIKKNKLSKLNDIFLDCAKNNIRRKIELRNQLNQEITIEL